MNQFQYSPETINKIRLHSRTMAPTAIATIMRCPVGTIEAICKKHCIPMRERDEDVVEPATPREMAYRARPMELDLDGRTFRRLQIEAKVRRCGVQEMAARVLRAVADGDIFAAVLDR